MIKKPRPSSSYHKNPGKVLIHFCRRNSKEKELKSYG